MHGELDQSPVRPGDTIAGKFLVERVVGSGGVGVVLAARHLQLDERVAIKFLLPQASKNVVDVARFCREAQAASKLKTEHVSRIIDTGVLEDGAPYMVMEYLEGRDLHEILRMDGPPPVEETLEYVLQAGVALAEAHLLGIVHRDIKPSNLFLTTRPDGTPLVKVLDFGIAKASVDVYTGVGPQELTKTSSLLGSPLYMSPEQIRSTKSVDARSDIWSLGIVLYELLCGSTPFDAESLTGVVASVIGSIPPPLGMRRADLPPKLVAVVNRCLEKEPADRFQSVAELATALEPFAPESAKISVVRILRLQSAKNRSDLSFGKTPTSGKTPSSASVTTDVSEPPSATACTLRSEGTMATRPARASRTWKLVLATTALTFASGGAAWYGWHSRQIPTPALPSSADNAPVSPMLDSQPLVPTHDAGSDAQEDTERDASSPVAASALVPTEPAQPAATVAVTREPPSARTHAGPKPEPKPEPTPTKPSAKDSAPAKIVDETVDTRL